MSKTKAVKGRIAMELRDSIKEEMYSNVIMANLEAAVESELFDDYSFYGVGSHTFILVIDGDVVSGSLEYILDFSLNKVLTLLWMEALADLSEELEDDEDGQNFNTFNFN